MNVLRLTVALATALALGGCAGTFRSHEPATSVYTLRVQPGTPAAAHAVDATLVVARPGARPGLDTDRIMVTLPDRRLDAYAGARWSAPLPRLVAGLLVDGLRAAGGFRAVVDDHSTFSGRYLLQVEIVEFAADYAATGAPPVARVALRGEFGVSGERRLVATASGSAAVAATADRQHEVAAAFEAAYAAAAGQLIEAVNAAAAAAAAPR